MSDYYSIVPKDYDENLRYRHNLRMECRRSEERRRAVMEACRKDILYFFNAACFLFEPRPMFREKDGVRKKMPMVIPFITWPHQDEAIRQIHPNLGLEDVGCVAEGTLVVTDQGLVPIEQVTRCHLVFDGVGFVRSEGAVFQGVKEVTDAYGMELTPDHQVLTVEGWKDAEKRIPRREVREPDLRWELRGGTLEASLGMRLWRGESRNVYGRKQGRPERRNSSLQQVLSSGKKPSRDSRREQNSVLSGLGGNAKALRKSKRSRLLALRRKRDCRLREMEGLQKLRRRHEAALQSRHDARAIRQRRQLLPRKLHLGRPSGPGFEQEEQSLHFNQRKADDGRRACSPSWDQRVKHEGANREGQRFACETKANKALRHTSRPNDNLGDGRDFEPFPSDNTCEDSQIQASTGPLDGAYKRAKTYDLVNCGPRRRFVAVGRDGRMVILHNCEKSRGEGMSWMAVLMALHDWLFVPNSKVGFVSRTERAADDPEDPDSLMWKAVWELSKLPPWMAGKQGVHWKRNVTNHTLVNLRNGARINAGAATGDVFRGGRLSWALMDEFAFFKKGEDADALNSSHGATNSRLFVSTVNGTNNEYYRIMHEPSNMVKVIIDWTQNISRNRGLYRFHKGVPVAVDPEKNPLPPSYSPPSQETLELFARLRRKGFKLEGERGEDPPLRSPWYDHECDRAGMTPQRIAQELGRDYAGSEYLVFGNEFNAHVKKQVKTPVHVGRFDLMEDTSDGELLYNVLFNTVPDGEVKLWVPLDVRGKPPRSMYALGADVSTGLGGSYTSNSTLIGIDLITREQVLAFASNTIEPSDFADLCVGIARWLFNAYLGWEHNGPGSAFTKRMIKTGYGHVYRRKSQSKNSRRETKEMGWWTDERTKPAMFSEISRAVQKGDAVVRDDALASEFKQYVYLNGKIEHAASLTTEDSSSRGKAHGDRVIAFGVALQCALDRPGLYQGNLKDDETPREPPPGTMAYRMKIQQEEAEKRSSDDWEDSVLERLN